MSIGLAGVVLVSIRARRTQVASRAVPAPPATAKQTAGSSGNGN
jgi:hypothetical protein